MITSKIGIGPMSPEIIEAVVEYSYEKNEPLMLIASRNQIDCEEYGGGYVGGFSSKSFVDYTRKIDKDKKVLICRDHSGPYFSAHEKNMTPDQAVESTLFSMKKDIEAGFDVMHVDCCMHKGNITEATQHLLKECLKYSGSLNKKLMFEVGSEENIGRGASDLKKFEKDIVDILDIVRPEFVVGQTGSLTKEIYQVGSFDIDGTKKLTAIAHEYGVKFKEHNADYSDELDLKLRSVAGVDAINVAPEFGYVQTKVITTLGRIHGFDKEVENFLNKSLASNKWEKWQYGKTTPELKAVIAGHYVFNSDEYRALEKALETKLNVKAFIKAEIKKTLDRYMRGLK